MIPVWEPVLDGNERKYVLDCLETNFALTRRPHDCRGYRMLGVSLE